MVHGGEWRTGDKAGPSDGSHKAAFFNAEGFVYVSVNYRLSPAVQHLAHAQDVAAALSWVADNISSHGGDPRQIFLMGHSAGAHLAALAARDPSFLGKHGKNLSILKGMILLDSAEYDIARNLEEANDGPLARPLYENAFGKDRATLIRASPIHYVKSGENIPPSLVFSVNRRPSELISNAASKANERTSPGTTPTFFPFSIFNAFALIFQLTPQTAPPKFWIP